MSTLRIIFTAVAAEAAITGVICSLAKDNTLQTAINAGLVGAFTGAAGTLLGAYIGDKIINDGTGNETSFIGKMVGGVVGYVAGTAAGLFLGLR